MYDTCDQRCRCFQFRMRIRGRKPRVMALRPPQCRVVSAALTPRRSCNSSRSRQALLSKAFRVTTVASTGFNSSGVAWRICIHSINFDGGVHAVCGCPAAEQLNRAIDYYMPSSSEDDDDDTDETAQPAAAAPKAAPADASQASSGTDADEHKRSRRYGRRTVGVVLALADRFSYLVGVGGVSAELAGTTRSASGKGRSVIRSGRSPKRMQTRC